MYSEPVSQTSLGGTSSQKMALVKMKVLIFEWLTGGGLWFEGLGVDQNCPFQSQGRSMFEALAIDVRNSGHQVLWTRDCRVRPNPGSQLDSKPLVISNDAHLQLAITCLADEADAILIIAPECDGCLSRVLGWLTPHQAKLASPNAAFVELASDKHATTQWLRKRGIAVPDGVRVSSLHDAKDRVSLPAIGKPNRGAGSDGIVLINNWNDPDLPTVNADWCVESFVPGTSLSVSVLSDGKQQVMLPPTGQVFDRPLGHYVAAKYPLAHAIAEQATELAWATSRALPPTKGYFGIDMIIGENDARVLEVNPRLTMSYVWLRQILPFNLAQKMLEMAAPWHATPKSPLSSP
jgi:predicted ATP-grasp superfamily ATP-dependent carboligase